MKLITAAAILGIVATACGGSGGGNESPACIKPADLAGPTQDAANESALLQQDAASVVQGERLGIGGLFDPDYATVAEDLQFFGDAVWRESLATSADPALVATYRQIYHVLLHARNAISGKEWQAMQTYYQTHGLLQDRASDEFARAGWAKMMAFMDQATTLEQQASDELASAPMCGS